jgi:hypothetical protein
MVVKFMKHFKGGENYKSLGTSGLDSALSYVQNMCSLHMLTTSETIINLSSRL